MDTNSSTSQTSTGATALLEKYAKLNSSIEDARKSKQLFSKKLEELTTQMQIEEQQRIDYKKETEEAKEATAKMTIQSNSVKVQLDYSQTKQTEALQLLKKTSVDNLRFKKVSSEGREVFIQKSREFRTYCKRMKLRLLQQTQGMDENVNTTIFLDADFILDQNCRSSNAGVDLEMEDAKKREAVALQEITNARQFLGSARLDHQNAREQVEHRNINLSRAHEQLGRLRKETDSIQKELVRLERETKEAHGMGEAFANDACRRKRAPNNSNNNSHYQYNSTAAGSAISNHNSNGTSVKGSSANPYNSSSTLTITPSPYGPSTPGAHQTIHHQQHPVYSSSAIRCINKVATVTNPYSRQPSSMQQQSDTSSKAQHLSKNALSSSSSSSYSQLQNPYNKNKFNNKQLVEPVLIQDDDEEEERSSTVDNLLTATNKNSNTNNGGSQQYPHRTGRVRVNRQFTTTVQIGSGNNENAAHNNQTSNLRSVNNNNNNNRCAQSNNFTSQRQPVVSTKRYNPSLDYDDDDEEVDDSLLNYVPFRKNAA